MTYLPTQCEAIIQSFNDTHTDIVREIQNMKCRFIAYMAAHYTGDIYIMLSHGFFKLKINDEGLPEIWQCGENYFISNDDLDAIIEEFLAGHVLRPNFSLKKPSRANREAEIYRLKTRILRPGAYTAPSCSPFAGTSTK